MPRKKKASHKGPINKTKVVVDGIQFQSTLESYMYKLLKDAKVDNLYEQKAFPLFEKSEYPVECWERFSKRSKQMTDRRGVSKAVFTPDFCDPHENWIIEVKGRALGDFNLRWKIFKDRMMERKDPPILFKPTNKEDCQQVLEILLSKGYGKQ